MTLKLDDVHYEYTLKEIAEACGIKEIRTARYYLNKVLPEWHRQGRGRYVTYPRATLNCFRLLTKLKDETPLQLHQISGVLKSLDQAQIDRIVSGEESLEFGFSVKDETGRYQTPGVGISEAQGSYLLVHGDMVHKVKNEDPAPYYSRDSDGRANAWKEFPVSDRVQIRYQGSLSYEQLEELRVVSRILKAIIGNEPQHQE